MRFRSILGYLVIYALIGCGGLRSGSTDHSSDAPPTMERAVAHFEAGRDAAARADFEALARLTPEGPRARLYLARLDARVDPKRGAQALDALDTAGTPAKIRAEARLHAALSAARAGDCKRAKPILASTVADLEHPSRSEAALALGLCTRGEDALAHLATAAQDPAQIAAVLRRADAVLAQMQTPPLESALETYGSGPLALSIRRALITRADASPEALKAAIAGLPTNDPAATPVRDRLQGARIGVVLPLSGRSRPIGQRLRDLTTLLGSEDDPDGSAQLIIRDGSTPAAAAAAVEAFIADGVSGIVGVFNRKAAAGAARAAAQSTVPVVMLTLSDAPLKASGPVWRALHTPSLVARTAAGAALGRGGQIAAVVYPDNRYGRTLADWFVKAWQAGGGTIAAKVDWPRKKPDFAKIAKRVANADPDTIFMPCDPTSAAGLLSHLAARGVWTRGGKRRFADDRSVNEVWIVGTPEWYGRHILQQGGRYAEGVMIPVPYAAETARGARFAGEISRELDRTSDAFDALLADSIRAVLKARHLHLSEGIPMTAALARIKLVDGATSGLAFGQRDAVPALFVLEISGGRFIPR